MLSSSAHGADATLHPSSTGRLLPGLDPVQATECRHGGSDHDQPICDARQLSLPERTDLVGVWPTAEQVEKARGERLRKRTIDEELKSAMGMSAEIIAIAPSSFRWAA